MLQTGSHGAINVEPTLATPLNEDLPRFLHEPRSGRRRSLSEALANLAGRGRDAVPPAASANSGAAAHADFRADKTPEFASVAHAPVLERAAPRPPRRGASATGVDAWMSRARRARRSAALRQFGAWSVTILVAGAIIAGVAIALTAFAAP